MFPIHSLFEAHLTVSDLERSMAFFGDKLGLELAQVFPERNVAFYWVGERGRSMLGLWQVGTAPQRMRLHVAFSANVEHVLEAPERLSMAGVNPLDFWERPTDEPFVLAWMPAASVYVHDPDGNLLEFIAMLPDAPRPELGVISWSEWKRAQ